MAEGNVSANTVVSLGTPEGIAAYCEAAIRRTPGLRLLARVWETPRALDLAVMISGDKQLLVRCVSDAIEDDHVALQTMLVQGPFTHALLVCADDAMQIDGPFSYTKVSDVAQAINGIAPEPGDWT